MQTFRTNKEKAAALAAQLWFIHEHSITPGDPNDKEPVFALLESLSETMED